MRVPRQITEGRIKTAVTENRDVSVKATLTLTLFLNTLHVTLQTFSFLVSIVVILTDKTLKVIFGIIHQAGGE